MLTHTDPVTAPKAQGFVTTPSDVVHFLTEWAVRTRDTAVLDVGLGDGRFLEAAARRLLLLGASSANASALVHGVEIDERLFSQAKKGLAGILGCDPPNLSLGSFLDAPRWSVEAVIGNPPYVRRHHIEELDRWTASMDRALPRLTDLSALFVYRATDLLQPGGRLAVIMSGGWLDQAYGRDFKSFLCKHYTDLTMVGFDDRVFADALVKPIALLGIRGTPDNPGGFIRTVTFKKGERLSTSAVVVQRLLSRQAFLASENMSSSIYSPEALDLLSASRLADATLGQASALRIGFQSFAKPFFLLESRRVARLQLDPSYLHPMVLSPRWLPDRLTLQLSDIEGRVFWAKTYAPEGTPASRYIEEAERTVVPVRGKGYSVTGYQNVPRLARARRQPWFNVAAELVRRGGAPLLLPRRTFVKFQVVHNPEEVQATEHFLELRPHAEGDLLPLLVYLNSTFGEIAVRLAAHQYGGGVFNLNPGQARHICLPLLQRLREATPVLSRAWESAARLPIVLARPALDAAVDEAFALSPLQHSAAVRLVGELQATAIRFAHPEERLSTF